MNISSSLGDDTLKPPCHPHAFTLHLEWGLLDVRVVLHVERGLLDVRIVLRLGSGLLDVRVVLRLEWRLWDDVGCLGRGARAW